jgi:phage FluMu protein Com
MEKHRCPHCDKLLYEGDFIGEVKTKCDRCKRMVTVKGTQVQTNYEKTCDIKK